VPDVLLRPAHTDTDVAARLGPAPPPEAGAKWARTAWQLRGARARDI